MTKLKIPETRDYQYGYELAYKLARERLSGADIGDHCARSGARFLAPSVAVVDYLNQPCRISFPEIEVSLEGGGDLRLREKILVLHYFALAQGTPPSSKLIAYKEIAGAVNYFATFSKRAIKPLVDNFGKDPGKLIGAAKIFNGSRAAYGDASVVIPAFNRVAITLVLWRGDDEFPPTGTILFDSAILDYLALEDINVLCETAAWRLVRTQKQ